MTRYVYISDSYLAHHGIKGMRWGKRNGPPYPLDASDKSAAERKAVGGSGSGKSKRKIDEEKLKKIKKGVAIGAGVAATAGLTAGAIYLAKHPQATRAALSGIKSLAINKLASMKATNSIRNAGKTLGRSKDDIKRSISQLKSWNKNNNKNIVTGIKNAYKSDQENNLLNKWGRQYARAERKGILSNDVIANKSKLTDAVLAHPEKLSINEKQIIDTHGFDVYDDLGQRVTKHKNIKKQADKYATEAKSNKGLRKAIKKAWVPVTATVGAAGTVAGTVGKLNNSVNTIGAAANNPYVKKAYNKTKKKNNQ